MNFDEQTNEYINGETTFNLGGIIYIVPKGLDIGNMSGNEIISQSTPLNIFVLQKKIEEVKERIEIERSENSEFLLGSIEALEKLQNELNDK